MYYLAPVNLIFLFCKQTSGAFIFFSALFLFMFLKDSDPFILSYIYKLIVFQIHSGCYGGTPQAEATDFGCTLRRYEGKPDEGDVVAAAGFP